jgi:hypothetical protein
MDFAQKIYDALDGNSDKGEYHQYHTIYAATLPEKLNSFLEIGISITERPGQSCLNFIQTLKSLAWIIWSIN